jgi:hypothetical protein
VRVSREFKANFDLVARFFRLEELGELDQAKEAVRRNPDDAAISFAEMARWVRLQAVTPAYETLLPVITADQINDQTSRINQAGKGRELRDVRGAGRDDSVGAQQFRRARQGKVTESA